MATILKSCAWDKVEAIGLRIPNLTLFLFWIYSQASANSGCPSVQHNVLLQTLLYIKAGPIVSGQLILAMTALSIEPTCRLVHQLCCFFLLCMYSWYHLWHLCNPKPNQQLYNTKGKVDNWLLQCLQSVDLFSIVTKTVIPP